MSIEDQKCKGCGFPTDCACTAGLNNYCGRCDPTWKTAAIGTYDDKYDAWVKANPRPVKPVFDPQPPIVAGDFICVQCTQCQEFTNVTAGGTLQMDPSQAQQCIGKLQNKLDAAKAADAVVAAAITPVAIPGAVAVPGGGVAPTPAAATTAAINPMMYLVIFAFLFLIVIAVFLATRSKTGQGEFVVDPVFAGACEC